VLQHRLLIGTYTTDRNANGLYVMAQQAGGGLGIVDTLALDDPSFVAFHPDRITAYVVGERPRAEGLLSRVEILDSGLRLIDTVALPGRLPCHAAVTPDARWLWIACYGSANVVVYPLIASGELVAVPTMLQHAGSSVHPRRQSAPHPHCVAIHPNGRDVYVTDLGTDRIEHYCVVGDGIHRREGSTARPGSGPRHIALDAKGERAVVAHELDNTVEIFEIGRQGELKSLHWMPSLPSAFQGPSFASEIVLAADVAWVGNRGHDSVTRLPLSGGTPAWLPTRGAHPRHFALSPDGTHLAIANRDSDNVVVYRLSGDTLPRSPEVIGRVPSPAFVAWL